MSLDKNMADYTPDTPDIPNALDAPDYTAQIFPHMWPVPGVFGEPRLQCDVLAQIRGDPETEAAYTALAEPEQKAFLEFCMGNRGLKVTYDPFFQHLFSPESHPERLDGLLSSIMGQKVKVRKVLPRERMRLSQDSSLIIMDVLVELAGGSLVSVEMQKTGYDFPVERSFCYGADLLLRQYDLAKKKYGKKFSYRDMRPVYIIVLMEKSPGLFRAGVRRKHSRGGSPERSRSGGSSLKGNHSEASRSVESSPGGNHYIHRSEFSFNTGLKMKSLENFVYISLDIFREMPHNELTELEAWMYFLSSDEPSDILRVVKKYPFFQELYQDIIHFRYNPKELITMYSEALSIMDKNTVDYMIDELRRDIQKLQKESERRLRQQEERNRQQEERNRQQEEENRILRARLEEYERKNAGS